MEALALQRMGARKAASEEGEQDEVSELGEQGPDAEGDGVEAEEAGGDHEIDAFAEGADGALGEGGEQGPKEVREVVDAEAEAEPGEIVGGEPGAEGVPIDPEAKEQGQEEGGPAQAGG